MTSKPEYCTNEGVNSCRECNMVNYGRDCNNNHLPYTEGEIRDMYPWYDGPITTQESIQDDARKSEQYKTIAIVSRAITEAIEYRAETLYRERDIDMLTQCDGDWISEFAESDPVMAGLHALKDSVRALRAKV